MKVKELIKELKEFNPNADVTLTTSEDIILSYIDWGGQIMKKQQNKYS